VFFSGTGSAIEVIFEDLAFSKQAPWLLFLGINSHGSRKHPNKGIGHSHITWHINIWNLPTILDLSILV